MGSTNKRRRRGEGSIERMPDGRYRAELPLGTDPATGKRRRMRFYGKTEAEALRKLREAAVAHGRGQLVASEKTAVADWLTAWLAARKAEVEPSTWKRYGECVNDYLLPFAPNVDLARLRPADVAAWYGRMADLTPDQRHKGASVLRAAIRHAFKLRLIHGNPAEVIPRPPVTRAEIQYLTEREVSRLLAVLRGKPYEALITLAIDSGARQGELFALQWGDLHGQTIRIARSLQEVAGKLRIKPTKTRRARAVRLATSTVKLLEGVRPPDATAESFIFLSPRGKFLRKSNLGRNVWYPALAAAGLPQMGFHSLRHTCATLLLHRGVHVKAVSERLGHQSVIVTLKTYQHVLPDMQERAADEMDKILVPASSPDDHGQDGIANVTGDAA